MTDTCLRGSHAGRAMRAGALCALFALAFALSMVPSPAWAYFNRGQVEVSLGASSLQLEAGDTSSVTATLSPASDEQTEGCGMPSCPQGCSDSCLDENGQCQCGGSDYSTYYADAVAISSDSSVAVAVYDAGTLTVYGLSEGEATITLSASLRQFTDGEASLEVSVSGAADQSADGSDAEVDVPAEADTEAAQEDKADVVDKTIMQRAIRYVRINEACEVEDNLYDFAGVDGDLTFWSGDTYYHPDYSLTLTGTDFATEDVFDFNPELEVSTQVTGTMSQILEGLDSYVLVDFEDEEAFPAPVTVYALAGDALADGDAVALYSFDEDTKSFVAEDAEATVEGGYVVFTVQEGKHYAVSTHDLASEATSVVEVGNSSTNAGGAQTGDGAAATTPPIVYAAVAIVVLAVAILVVLGLALRRGGKKQTEEGAANEKR